MILGKRLIQEAKAGSVEALHDLKQKLRLIRWEVAQ